MEVRLISWTPDPEVLSAAAARQCYSDVSATSILRELTTSDVERLLRRVLSSGHLSVVEHVTFTFAIDGVSRVLTHQLVRHRVGVAFSQQSQRYSTVGDPDLIVPRSMRPNEGLTRRVASVLSAATALYHDLLGLGIAAEDARYVLPQAISTRLVMTANLRALINMYRLDACFRSQWEMRELMRACKREIGTVSQRLASELKIKCFAQGYCDEASMCSELKERMPRRDAIIGEDAALTRNYYARLASSVGEEPA